LRRRTAYAVAGVASLALIGTTFVAATATTPNPPGPSARAQSAINSGAVKLHGDATGHVDYLSAPSGHALAAPKGMTAKSLSSATDVARANVDDFASAFGVADPKTNLVQIAAASAVGGGTTVRYQQTDAGLPVIGAQLVVSQNSSGALEAINGRAGSVAGVSTTATLTAAKASAAALSATSQAAKVGLGGLVASTPKLSLYDPTLLHATNVLGTRSVYQVTVTDKADPTVNQYVLVDAKTGTIALIYSQNGTPFAPTAGPAKVTKSAKVVAAKVAPANAAGQSIKVCDFKDAIKSDETCKSPISSPGTSSVTDVKDAFNFLTGIDNFYNTEVGRKGIDNKEMPVLATVRYCPDSEDCPYSNSFWDGDQVVFGDGFPQAPDVVGHEYTHGVTQDTSDLMYYYQSGAINESMSDTMGELYDFSNGSDDPSGQWLFGEDLPSPEFERNMSDPTQSGQGAQPDSMSSGFWSTDGFDNGGVHTDSGVGNKAAYLAAEGTGGAPFNGVTVAGIAADSSSTAVLVQRMAEIWYTANTLMMSGADYADFGNALTQACTNLGTTAGITAADCASVQGAVAATKMESTTSTHLPAQAAQCGTGYTAVNAFSDNFDRAPTKTGQIGNGWTQTGSPTITEAASPNQKVTGNQAYIPEPFPDTKVVARYAYTPSVKVSSAHTSYLSFQHLDSLDWIDGADQSPSFANLYMEGMFVDYQISGSSTWHTLSTATWTNGPTKTVYKDTFLDSDGVVNYDPSDKYSNKGFAGDSRGWSASRATLPSSLKGKTLKFRFEVETDGYDYFSSSYGELLDNVAVNDCVKAPLAPTSVAVKGYSGSATMTWGASSTNGGDAISAYAVYVKDGVNGSYVRTTLSASTRSHTWTGLTAGHDYYFTIRAENSAGAYSPYAPSPVTELIGSALNITANPSSVTSGTPVTLSGKLTAKDTGAPLATRTIALYDRKAGTTTYTAVTSTVTAADGSYSFTVSPTQSEDYYVHYSTGSPTTMGVSTTHITVTVTH
jgi:Zn-dependent metalloprotease